MHKPTKNKFAIGVLVLFLITPSFVVFAAYPPVPVVSPPTVTGPISSAGSASGGIIFFFNNILAWLATIFWIAAVIFVLYAAFLYLTAAGDEKKVETATHVLKYAIVAIIVGLMAYGLPLLITNILGATA